jgi:hypothetical protein
VRDGGQIVDVDPDGDGVNVHGIGTCAWRKSLSFDRVASEARSATATD